MRSAVNNHAPWVSPFQASPKTQRGLWNTRGTNRRVNEPSIVSDRSGEDYREKIWFVISPGCTRSGLPRYSPWSSWVRQAVERDSQRRAFYFRLDPGGI